MPIFKRSLWLVLFLLFCGAAGTMYGYYQQDTGVALGEGASSPAAEAANQITVYIAGEVNNPGLVKLPFNARLLDGVEACGGALPTADLSRLNMAQTLKDGARITVPAKKSASSTGTGNGSSTQSAGNTGTGNSGSTQIANSSDNSNGTTSSSKKKSSKKNRLPDEPININTATVEELTGLPGVGEAMAKRIVAYRESQGMFMDLSELRKVKGMGAAKLEKIKEYITT